ncbi:MAG: D-alanyl-D-alanine carboxypeptidase family protein, partial [Fibrobacteres bacterium]|nr:D-alanyl-D-alanine carboxypeptidase family protein [Fibrobacterota bacterium]
MRQPAEFTLEEVTGQSRGHLREVEHLPAPARCFLHRDVVGPYLAMRAAAAIDGIDLVAFSGFRDFERQLAIWNGKFRGERPVQDRAGQPFDIRTRSPRSIGSPTRSETWRAMSPARSASSPSTRSRASAAAESSSATCCA